MAAGVLLPFILAAVTIASGPQVTTTHPHETISIPVAEAQLYVRESSEGTMLHDLNARRAAAGLAPLVRDARLTEVARAYAREMLQRGFFGHLSPEGNGPAERLAAAGIRYRAAGENLAYEHHTVGPDAPTAVDDERTAEQGLYESPPHRANILHAGFRKVGIGAVGTSVYGTVFVQLFSD